LTKKTSLKMTPIMSLAILALFTMMIPLFTVANAGSRASRTSAEAPTPTATPDVIDYMEK